MDETGKYVNAKKTYQGRLGPEAMVFDANLQEFSQKVGYICSLENSGKISPAEAYAEIKRLWKDLKQSRKALRISEDATSDESPDDSPEE